MSRFVGWMSSERSWATQRYQGKICQQGCEFAAADDVLRPSLARVDRVGPDVHRLPRALLFALNGFLALVAVAALLGVWFGRTGGG